MSNQLPLALLQITEATHTCRRLIVFIGEKQDPSVITVIEIGGVYMIVKAKSCLLHRNKATAHTGAGEWGTPTGHYMHAGNPQLPSFGRALFLYFVFFFFYRKVEPIDCKPGKNKQGDILGLDHGSFWKTCSQLWALPEEGCDIKGRDSRQFSQGSECVLEGATSVFQLQVAFLSTQRHCSHL